MGLERVREGDEPAEVSAAARARATQPDGTRTVRAGLPAALARVVAAGVPLSNRAVGRLLQRQNDAGYGYGFVDDPLNAGGFGPDDATVRVRPGPVRTTVIRPRDTTPVHETTPGATDTPAPAPTPVPLSAFRTAILAEAQKLVPATEPEAKFYAAVDKAALEKARADADAKGNNHTTCIDFQTVVTSRASLKAKGKLIRLSGIVAHTVYPKAWHTASAGMPSTERPRPGDVYVLHKKANPAKFSHLGILKSITPPAAGGGVETWITIDGGQGSRPHEQHKENIRYYHPDNNWISGEANQGDSDAILFGWVDVDKL